MKISRRDFLQDSVITTAGAFAILNDPLSSSLLQNNYSFRGLYRGTLAIMQGLATLSTSQFVVLTPSTQTYGYVVLDAAGKQYPTKITTRETRSHSQWGIEKLLVTNLKINTDYVLRVIEPSNGIVIDERTFKSLDTNKVDPKLLIASCMKDNNESKREEMWDNVSQSNPDIVFLIGDTCYSDNGGNDGSDADYWRRYCETRSLLSHFRQKRLIPTLAVWDDHDFSGNNADSTFPKKDMMKQLFKLFWDNEIQEKVLVKGPGISQIFTAFGQRFFMMDSRYYRSPREQQDYPVQWGTLQETFLFENLAKSKSPAWIMNGSQFFGGYLKKDAFEFWHQDNFNYVCRELAKQEAPVVFASGDVHFTEYMRIEPQVLGYETFEITSSAIHSTTIPFNHLRKKNPRRIDANSANQFTLVKPTIDLKTGWTLETQSLKAGLKETLKETMIVKR